MGKIDIVVKQYLFIERGKNELTRLTAVGFPTLLSLANIRLHPKMTKTHFFFFLLNLLVAVAHMSCEEKVWLGLMSEPSFHCLGFSAAAATPTIMATTVNPWAKMRVRMSNWDWRVFPCLKARRP